MSAPAIRLIEGLHLTATNRRHLSQLLSSGRTWGGTVALRYQLAPVAGQPDHWRYAITKRERDDWGRAVDRVSRGIIAATLSTEST
jgi:hypothetical protein